MRPVDQTNSARALHPTLDSWRLIRRAGWAVCLVLALLSNLMLGGCGETTRTLPSMPSLTGAPVHNAYLLGPGDKVRVIVFGEKQLSGTFDVDSSGNVSLPLIGNTKAAGLTPEQFSKVITASLKQGYVNNPKVSVEVADYRDFYIIGEVNKAGEYPYTSGLTVLGAIAIANGYTYRANQRYVYIRRPPSNVEFKSETSENAPIKPGDVIRVPQRYF